jgi:hypothetical protein
VLINVQFVEQLVHKVDIDLIHFFTFNFLSAHTIKYCQATGDDTNRHLPTPYEKMLHIQTFGFDDTIPSYLGQFSSPSSLYSNGWSDSYL